MSISNADQEVLAALAANGDDHRIPRDVAHFFFGDRQPLEDVAGKLEKVGWADLELARGTSDHRLVATIHTDLLEPSVLSMMSMIEEAMKDVDVEYDGWEASLERNN